MITKNEIVEILKINQDGWLYYSCDERGIVFMEKNLGKIAQEILDKIEDEKVKIEDLSKNLKIEIKRHA